MATSTRSGKTGAKSKTARSASMGSNGKSASNAIALLKADHREVTAKFEEFKKARSADRKQQLAQTICQALKVHSQIEEEIFYPAFLQATKDKDLHHEAIIEHSEAKHLISEIEAASPSDDYYDAKVSVLSEMIKHHVKEEEQPGGLFSEVSKTGL